MSRAVAWIVSVALVAVVVASLTVLWLGQWDLVVSMAAALTAFTTCSVGGPLVNWLFDRTDGVPIPEGQE